MSSLNELIELFDKDQNQYKETSFKDKGNRLDNILFSKNNSLHRVV